MPSTTTKGVPHSIGSDAAATIDTSMQALAEWVDSAPGVSPLSTSARDALSGAALWNGRLVWNTAEGRLERYNSGAGTWESIFKAATVFRDTKNFTVQGEVRVDNADRDFYIVPFEVDIPAGQTTRIVRIRHRLALGGTATCALDRIRSDGSTTRFATFTASTSLGVLTTGLPLNLTDGDLIALVITGAASTPKHLTVGVAYELER